MSHDKETEGLWDPQLEGLTVWGLCGSTVGERALSPHLLACGQTLRASPLPFLPTDGPWWPLGIKLSCSLVCKGEASLLPWPVPPGSVKEAQGVGPTPGREPPPFWAQSSPRCSPSAGQYLALLPPAASFMFLLEALELPQHYPHQVHCSWPGPQRAASCQAWK